jgi:hypothetical protein
LDAGCFLTESETVNFKKLMLIVVPLAVLLVGYKYMTKVDRSDPAKVGTAFAKALKANNISKAGSYYTPSTVEAWRDEVGGMRSGAAERYRERVPADPQFGPPVSAAGLTTITSTDKSYTLQMQQVDGKWYVSNAPR